MWYVRLITALQITWFTQVAARNYPPLIYSEDLYFHRIVPLHTYNDTHREIYGIGVHISSDRILTSFNPYRQWIRKKEELDKLNTTALMGYGMKNGTQFYTLTDNSLACGRQVQILPDSVINKEELWHGTGNRHCPLHDLLVFRIDNSLEVSTLETENDLQNDVENTADDFSFTHNLFLTKLAEPMQGLDGDFKFCMVVDERFIKVTYYTENERALLNCNEWLPRNWGVFICIRNKDNYKEVSSGAMLVSNNTLFGVGSFVLTRGKESIIVFTDVRPYSELINNTCTYDDSGETEQGSKSTSGSKSYQHFIPLL